MDKPEKEKTKTVSPRAGTSPGSPTAPSNAGGVEPSKPSGIAEIIDVSHVIDFRCTPAGVGIYKIEVEVPEKIKAYVSGFTWDYVYASHAARTGGVTFDPDKPLHSEIALDVHDPNPQVTVTLSLKDLRGHEQIIKDFFDWDPDVTVKTDGTITLKSSPGVAFNLGAVLSLPPAVADTQPTTVRMTRSHPNSTGDVGLWMMIKASSENLSWKKYSDAMDMVLTCNGSDGDVRKTASDLTHRRALPFTDTDSYRALKVATEAFLLVNTKSATDWENAFNEGELPDYLYERNGFSVAEVKAKFDAYYLKEAGNNWVIPYLAKVAENLKGTAAGANAAAQLGEFNSFKYSNDPNSANLLGCWQKEETAKLSQPLLIELIWSYWMEEMQLVQSMHAISRRFQNVHSSGVRDPLAPLEADALRPLGNLLWGYVQDEQHRLTLARRAFEYSHHYGLALIGKAVPQLRPADNRSKFIEAFHNLLSLCAQFFRQADDTTVVADGFPVLNALREVHLLLSEGGGNQFRDLPATARVEMLMEQWILARSEFREFLPRRAAIAYPEDWMHSVDSMRRLQGWGDTNVLHFWHLATCGERVVASIRWGNWNEVLEPEKAANWASFFRPDIQSYIHAYRAVTGVDITLEPVDSTMPSVHLFKRQAVAALSRK